MQSETSRPLRRCSWRRRRAAGRGGTHTTRLRLAAQATAGTVTPPGGWDGDRAAGDQTRHATTQRRSVVARVQCHVATPPSDAATTQRPMRPRARRSVRVDAAAATAVAAPQLLQLRKREPQASRATSAACCAAAPRRDQRQQQLRPRRALVGRVSVSCLVECLGQESVPCSAHAAGLSQSSVVTGSKRRAWAVPNLSSNRRSSRAASRPSCGARSSRPACGPGLARRRCPVTDAQRALNGTLSGMRKSSTPEPDCGGRTL